ncbi:uncharacterized protein LOC105438197 isoform X1 [Strongylocentrotus purpuratus]|uniref:Uncharacterized protein n=1 Tax=Strongylocentrotus purpuratus TaxID=7668 RepID=A0A7M7N050_STRPU|nr:uncharacterized protein LOC105438197 isoform X1 [Strongylocentrotus purpuratus]
MGVDGLRAMIASTITLFLLIMCFTYAQAGCKIRSCGDCRKCNTYVPACEACYYGIATRKRNSLIGEAATNDETNELQRAPTQTSVIPAKRPTCNLDQVFSKLPPEIQRQIEELILSTV